MADQTLAEALAQILARNQGTVAASTPGPAAQDPLVAQIAAAYAQSKAAGDQAAAPTSGSAAQPLAAPVVASSPLQAFGATFGQNPALNATSTVALPAVAAQGVPSYNAMSTPASSAAASLPSPGQAAASMNPALTASSATPSANGFGAALLKEMGLPVTAKNLQFLDAWQQAEGGSADNPFNTTQGAPGATEFNSVGVKRYPSEQAGLAATAKTLENGYYGPILAAMAQSDPQAAAQAVAASPWGTGAGVESVLAGGVPLPAVPGLTQQPYTGQPTGAAPQPYTGQDAGISQQPRMLTTGDISLAQQLATQTGQTGDTKSQLDALLGSQVRSDLGGIAGSLGVGTTTQPSPAGQAAGVLTNPLWLLPPALRSGLGAALLRTNYNTGQLSAAAGAQPTDQSTVDVRRVLGLDQPTPSKLDLLKGYAPTAASSL